MKKVKNLLLALIITLFGVINVDALQYEAVGDAKVVSSDYAFTPRFIQGNNGTKVKIEYGSAKKCEDDDHCGHDQDYVLKKSQNYKDIYALYENVGTYHGKQVDLKITISSIDFGSSEIAEFHFDSERIAIGFYKADNAFFKIQYIDHSTGKDMNIKSVISYSDIDGPTEYQSKNNVIAERIGVKDTDADYIYVYEPYGMQHFKLETSNGYNYLTGTKNWTGICGELVKKYNGEEVNFYSHDGDVNCYTYGAEDGALKGGHNGTGETVDEATAKTQEEFYSKAGIATVLYNTAPFTLSWNHYFVELTSVGFLEIEEPAPIKSVDKQEAKVNDELIYTIIQEVPNQVDDWYYATWSIVDQFPSQVDFTVDDVTITDDSGEDVTDNFELSMSDNKLTIEAKGETLSKYEFYNNSYKITVKTIVNDSAKKDDILKNYATHTIQNASAKEQTSSSNEVETRIIVDEIPVPSTSSSLSNWTIMFGAFIAIMGGIIYFVILNKLKKNNQ